MLLGCLHGEDPFALKHSALRHQFMLRSASPFPHQRINRKCRKFPDWLQPFWIVSYIEQKHFETKTDETWRSYKDGIKIESNCERIETGKARVIYQLRNIGIFDEEEEQEIADVSAFVLDTDSMAQLPEHFVIEGKLVIALVGVYLVDFGVEVQIRSLGRPCCHHAFKC